MSIGPIQSAISRLQAQVAALQGQAGGGEALSPNYLTVNAAGQVGASFSGLVNALGLILPAAGNTTGALTNRVEWTRSSDGAAVATILGYETGVGPDTDGVVVAGNGQTSNAGAASLSAFANAGANNATITVLSSPGVSSSVAEVFADSAAATLLNTAGQSSFLQLSAGPTELALAVGTSQLSWAGASQDSGGVVITHNIGRVPTVHLTSDAISDGSEDTVFSYSTRNTTQVFVNCRAVTHVPANGVTCNFSWACFG